MNKKLLKIIISLCVYSIVISIVAIMIFSTNLKDGLNAIKTRNNLIESYLE